MIGDKPIVLRSRHAWKVLAYMLLRPANAGSDWRVCSRAEVANLFFRDSANSANSLRQIVFLLKNLLPSFIFEAESLRLQLNNNALESDLSELFLIDRKLNSDDSSETVMDLLESASTLIRGSFLEDVVDLGTGGYDWYQRHRADVDGLSASLLTRYSTELEKRGDVVAAFNSAARVLKLQPTSQSARDRVWELGSKAHIVVEADTLNPDDDFEDLLPKLNRRLKRGSRITSRESVLFGRLLEERLEHLSQKEALKLYKLAMLPDEFTPALARALCGVTHQQLSRLLHLKLVVPTNSGCTFHEPVRSAMRRKLPLPDRRRTLLRLHAICIEYVKMPTDIAEQGSLFPNSSAAEATVVMVAEELTRDAGTVKVALDIITVAASCGYGKAVYPMRSWVLNVLGTAEAPELIYLAVCCMGLLELGVDNFVEAAEICEEWLPACTAFSVEKELQISDILTIAWHRLGDTERALTFSDRQITLCRTLNLQLGIASALRFRAEIFGAAGRTDEMFSCLQQALQIYVCQDTNLLTMAECHYQLAVALQSVGRYSEAYSYAEKALGARTQLNDITGVEQCLRVFAEIRAELNLLAEALMHIDHALLLCDAVKKPANRAAALLIKSTILEKQGLQAEAIDAAQQALDYWVSVSHQRWIGKCRARLHNLGQH